VIRLKSVAGLLAVGGGIASCGFIAGIENLGPAPADASTVVDGTSGTDAADAQGAHDALDAHVSLEAGDALDAATGQDGPDAADAPATCDGGIVCDGACVDPTSDPANCNGCGNVCATGVCGVSIVADMTTQPAAWQFNGSAQYNKFAPSGELTVANVLGQSGTMIYTNAVVIDTFDATFEFRMGLQGGTRSDGMGFMLERTGPAALGASGGALGMVGLDGYAVELDIYDNGTCGDPSSDHVGIDSLALCDPNDVLPTSFAATDLTGTIDLGDASWHAVTVHLGSGAMTVTIDAMTVATAVSLAGFQPGTPYYFGFGGGTGQLVDSDGGGGYRTEVKNVAIKFPTPRCL